MPYLAGESRRRADSQLSSSIKRSRLELEIALPCGEIVGILREDGVCLCVCGVSVVCTFMGLLGKCTFERRDVRPRSSSCVEL